MTYSKYFLLLLSFLFACAPQTDEGVLERLHQMEQGVKNGQPMQIAAIYADDGYVINPNRIEAQGREAINEYWQNLGSASTDWKLESFMTSKKLKNIIESQQWEQLERKPRLPEQLDIPLSGNLLYQLGRSHLTISDGEETHTSTVDFIIVWKIIDGEYRIWIDSYA